MTVEIGSIRHNWSGAFFLILILPIGVALYMNRDPWVDEAMLANNFVEMSLSQIRHPMPLYEQAAPVGHILLAKLVLLFSGLVDRTFALRALSALISLVGVTFLVQLACEEASAASALAVAAVAFTSPFFVRYATEIKQYIFDFTATALIAYSAARIARSATKRDFISFLIASLFGCVFSFVAIIPIAFCLSAAALVRIFGGSHDHHAFSLRGAKKLTRNEFECFVVFGGGSLLIAIAFYFIFSRSMTSLLMAAYSDVFKDPYIGPGATYSENFAILVRFAKFLIIFWTPENVLAHLAQFGSPVKSATTFGLLVFILVAFVFCAIRSSYVAISFCGAIALTIILNAANVVTIIFPRYLFFLAPLLYLVIGLGVVEAYQRIVRRFSPGMESIVRVVCIISFLAVFGIVSTHSANVKIEEISPLLSRIRTGAPDAPVWVYYGAQPAVRFLASKAVRQVGLFDPSSIIITWMVHGGGRLKDHIRQTDARYPLTIETALKSQPRAWLIFSHAWVEPSFEPYLAAARCRALQAGRYRGRQQALFLLGGE